MDHLSPFRLMNIVFVGLTISVAYGLIGANLVYFLDGVSAMQAFMTAYTTSFKTLLTFGLILGTALIVYLSQDVIPATIRDVFTPEALAKTRYPHYKKAYISRRRSAAFATEFWFVAFFQAYFCQFPLSGVGEGLMVLSVCLQYAGGVYVGRKLCYAGMMLRSLLEVDVTRNLFEKHELDKIDQYVNIVSTLAIIFVYAYVASTYRAPFLCSTVFGEGMRFFLLAPLIVAAPVLIIFNFYPRIVLRELYSRSIDVEINNLRHRLRNEKLSAFERRSQIIAFDKMYRDELRYSMRLTLSDLPIGITILIMVLGTLLGK